MMFGVIVLVIIAYYMFNSSKSGGPCCMDHQPHAKDALDTLSERYARGEMDREDYLERKQELSGQKQTISIKKG